LVKLAHLDDLHHILIPIPLVYYLPVWFQAIKGNSAVESGIHLLPMVLAIVVASIFTGIATSRIGYYVPFLIFGICTAAIGAGLLNTLSLNTTAGQWIGFQILYGFGLGCCAQAPNVAAQTVLPRNEVSIGASLMLFAQTISGAIFVSVGQNVLDSRLVQRLTAIVPSITPQQIENAGATGLYDIIPSAQRVLGKQAYNDALRSCFEVGLIMACLSIIGGLGMEWRSVKRQQATPPVANAEGEKAFVGEGPCLSDAGDDDLKGANR
jgi:MFS family permease